MGKPAIAIELTAAERAELEGLASRRRTAQGLARRARIVLAAAEGVENQVIARTLGADENTVGKWRRRFAERRIEGLHDEPRPGAPRQLAERQAVELVQDGAMEALADAVGLRAFRLGAGVVDVLDREVELVFVAVAAAELGA